jgi:hypothetical protein
MEQYIRSVRPSEVFRLFCQQSKNKVMTVKPTNWPGCWGDCPNNDGAFIYVAIHLN